MQNEKDTVDIDDISIQEVGAISQGTDNIDSSFCLRIDIKGVDFNELIDRLVGHYGYEHLIEKIEKNYK